MQAQFLGDHIGGEEALNVKIALPVIFQRSSDPAVAFPGQVKGFDHAHALDLFQYASTSWTSDS